MDLIFNNALSLFGVMQEETKFVKFEEEEDRSPLRSSSSSTCSTEGSELRSSSASTCSAEGSELRSCLKAKKAWADFRPKTSAAKNNCRHVHFENAAEEKVGRMIAARRYSISRNKRV